MWRTVTTLFGFGLIASAAAGQGRIQQAGKTVDTLTSKQALQTFARLVDKENYRAMGFDTPTQVLSATLGEPIAEFMIRLDELKAFATGRDPAALVHETGRVTFFVLVNGRTRSSLTLSRRDQGWEAVAYGNPGYARALDELRARLAARDGQAIPDYIEVRVPALNVTFLGSRRAGRLFLTPLLEDPRFGFSAGATLAAEDALLAMVTAAQAHNDLPT